MKGLEPLAVVTARSLAISGTATLLASLWSIPLAYALSSPSRARGLAVTVLEALVGVPTVLIGLLLYMLLSTRGPLAGLNLLYTPAAIVLGEAILVTPLIIAVSHRVLREARPALEELALTLGATQARATLLVLRESLPGLISAVVMGFSRAIGELGVALIVGGNIRGATRTLTTSIALATQMGEYELAVRLGAVLVALTVVLGVAVRVVAERWLRY